MTTNNLGDQAQTGTLIVDNIVRSPSFSQPFIADGSPTEGNISSLAIYVEGINKYVWYRRLVNNILVNGTYVVEGIPLDFISNHSVITSVTAVSPTGASFTTAPLFQATTNYFDSLSPTRVLVNIRTTRTGVFTGIAYVKIVTQFTKD